MTIDQAVEIAKIKILPPGFKPEDYLCISDDYPIKMAILICKEARHILKIHNLRNNFR